MEKSDMEYEIRENGIPDMNTCPYSPLDVLLFQKLRGECLKLYVFHPEYLSEELKTVMFTSIQNALNSVVLRIVYSIELEERNYPFPFLSLTSRGNSHLTVYLIPDGAENVIREMAREGDLYGISQPCICSDDIPRGYVESNHAANYAFCLNQNFRIYHSYEIAEHEGLNRLVSHFASQLSTKRFTIALKQLRTYLFDVQHEKISAVQFIEAIEIIRKTVIDSYGKMVPEEERELIHWELPVTRSSEFMQCLETWLETYRYYILLDLEGNQKIQKAIDYMKEHYTENLNMAIVSNYVSMNYSQFSVEFKKYTGESFVTYLKKIRIEEAKRLLVETNLKIAALALRAGFHDEKHFMKVFRTEVGVTPTEYRKNRELSLESGKNKL